MTSRLEIPFDLDVGHPDADMLMHGVDGEMVTLGIPADGGVAGPLPATGHDDNLALVLPSEALHAIASDLVEAVERDKQSRMDWDKALARGLEQTGFDRLEAKRDNPFPGAFPAHHPLLAQAMVDFQGRAIRELWPQEGPVRCVVVEDAPDEVRPQLQGVADRLQKRLNRQLLVEMPEARSELDAMLMLLPLTGSAFVKVFWDAAEARPRREFVMSEHFIVPYTASSLETAPRYTHVLLLETAQVRVNQAVGLWAGGDLGQPQADGIASDSRAAATAERIEGRQATGAIEDARHEIYEVHADLDISELFDDGLVRPYIVTVHRASSRVLSLRRNWRDGDDRFRKRLYFCHYKYFPWRGFYGIGLWHVLGGLAEGATGTLRALMDSAAIANMPGGVRLKGSRVSGSATAFRPLEWSEIDAPGAQDIRHILMPWPTNGPNAVMLELLGMLAQAGERFGGVATQMVVDTRQDAPVGTTLALLEQGSVVYSAIHARLHHAQSQELRVLAELNAEFLPGAEASDFSLIGHGIDILPASDPRVFSQVQRVARAQAAVALVKEAAGDGVPVDLRSAYLDSARALGLSSSIDTLFPPPPEPLSADPLAETLAVLTGRSIAVRPDQDHKGHLVLHGAMLGMLPLAAARPLALHILEHVQAFTLGLVATASSLPPGGPVPERILGALQAEVLPEMLRPMTETLKSALADPGQGQDIGGLIEVERLKVQQRREEAAIEAALDRERMENQARLADIRSAEQKEVIDRKLKAQIAVEGAKLAQRDRETGAELVSDGLRGHDD